MTVAPASCIHVLAMLPTITPIKTENMCRLRQGKNEEITRSKNIWRDLVARTPPMVVPAHYLRRGQPVTAILRKLCRFSLVHERGPWARSAHKAGMCSFPLEASKHGHFGDAASKGLVDAWPACAEPIAFEGLQPR